jgi:hypothetical protein
MVGYRTNRNSFRLAGIRIPLKFRRMRVLAKFAETDPTEATYPGALDDRSIALEEGPDA